MTIVKIEANVQWKFFRAKGGNWVAICDPLALTVQSETWAALMEDIAETLNAMMKDLMETSELNRFLQDRGWRPVDRIPSKPDDVWFDIPISIIQAANRDSQVSLYQ